MTFFESIFLGIIEGITEFLPISSTGHLILTSELLGIAQTDFIKSFQIGIQLGAILSVVVLYWRHLLLKKKLIGRVILAFFPTAVLGLIFYSTIKRFLSGNP
jgi:undecaprenyl-diphosphatase